MLDFLNTRISTIAGIIILLLVAGSVGVMIFRQLHQLMAINFEVIESEIQEKPLE